MIKFELTFISSGGEEFVENITGEYGNVLSYIQGYMAGTGCTLAMIRASEVEQ